MVNGALLSVIYCNLCGGDQDEVVWYLLTLSPLLAPEIQLFVILHYDTAENYVGLLTRSVKILLHFCSFRATDFANALEKKANVKLDTWGFLLSEPWSYKFSLCL